MIYEDEHILLVNKPEGILSQKAEADDISMVEEAQALSAEQRSRNGGIPPNLPPVGGKPAGPGTRAASWLWEKTWRGPRS